MRLQIVAIGPGHTSTLRQSFKAHGRLVFKSVGDLFQTAFPATPQILRVVSEGQASMLWQPLKEMGGGWIGRKRNLHTVTST